MNSTTRPGIMSLGFAIVLVVTWLSAASIPAHSQGSQGQNAVYPASGQCCVGTSAFIDASMFASQNGTICSIIYSILQLPGYSAAVIDARGLPNSTPPTSMTCAAGTTPWSSGSTYQNKPSTILLPATGGTTAPNPIIIPNSSPWVLPPNTHVIGAGDGITVTGSFAPSTTIQAASGFSGAMIQFGPSLNFCFPPNSASICTGISVENLTLDGQGQSINGIVNQFAGNQSYVDHVSLYRILGTALWLTVGASQSGPYSNITYDLGGESGTSSTICANLNGLTGTRGIRGLSCISENNIPPAAVLLDASNNSLQDVRIAGFYDGIRCRRKC